MENMFDLLDDWENLFYKMCQFYSISIKDEEGNFKCLWEIFRELNEAMKDLTSSQNHDII